MGRRNDWDDDETELPWWASDDMDDDDVNELDFEGIEAEDAIAFNALVHFHTEEGDEDENEARRIGFAAIAQDALALKERRHAREAALAEALEQEQREEEERLAREAAERRAREAAERQARAEAERLERERMEEEERRLQDARDLARWERQRRARQAQESQRTTEPARPNRGRTNRSRREAPAPAAVSKPASCAGQRPAPKPRQQAAQRRSGTPTAQQSRPGLERRNRARAEDRRLARQAAQARAQATQADAQRERQRRPQPRQAPRPAPKPRAKPSQRRPTEKVTGRSEATRAPEKPPAPPKPAGTLTGSDLAAWRAHRGYNQQAAAKHLGVGQGTISKAERNGSKPLGPTLQRALASALASGAAAR